MVLSRRTSFFSRFIRAKRFGGQAGPVAQIRLRGFIPRKTNRDRLVNSGGGNFHRVAPAIFAPAGTNFPSAPATVNQFNGWPSRLANPPSMSSNFNTALPPSIFIPLNTGPEQTTFFPRRFCSAPATQAGGQRPALSRGWMSSRLSTRSVVTIMPVFLICRAARACSVQNSGSISGEFARRVLPP